MNSIEFLSHFPNSIIETASRSSKWDKVILWNFHSNISLVDAITENTSLKRDVYFTPNWSFQKICWWVGKFRTSTKDKKQWEEWYRPWDRSVDTATDIHCCFVEIDWNKNKRFEWLLWEWYWNLKDLIPSIVVKTKKWYHVYYLFDESYSYNALQDRRKIMQRKLIEMFWGDTKAKDIARLLRIPWCKYWKDWTGETMITIDSFNNKKYRFDELENTINWRHSIISWDVYAQERILQKVEPKHKKHFNDIFREISYCDVSLVLEKASRQRFTVSWPFIHDWWTRTNWYKYHKSLNFVNNFAEESADERPNWWPRCVAKFFMRNNQEVFQFFMSEFWIKTDDIPIDFDKLNEVKPKETLSVLNNPRIEIGDHQNWLIIEWAKNKTVWYSKWDEWTYIDWTIEPIWRIVKDNKDHIILHIRPNNSEERIVLCPIMSSTTDLRKFLCWYSMIPDEWKKFFVYLMQYIFSTKEKYYYTNKLWMQYIDWKRIIVDRSWVYYDKERKIYIEIKETNDIKINHEDVVIEPREFVSKLLSWYNSHTSYVSFLLLCLWVNAYWFRTYKHKKWVFMPMWFVRWLSQSWKSTMLNNLFNAFWLSWCSFYSWSTPFVYEMNAKHYVPFNVTEYRNSSQGNRKDSIEWILRNMFDWTSIKKGKADQSINEYEINAQYIFDWQTCFTDDAVLTRMIVWYATTAAQWEIKQLQSLPSFYNTAINIFKTDKDFENYIALCDSIKAGKMKDIRLWRWSTRSKDVFSFLFWLQEMLWLWEFNNYLIQAYQQHDSITAKDDVMQVYQKTFNLTSILWFDIELFKNWLIITIIPEQIRYWLGNIDDLKWHIETINNSFQPWFNFPDMCVFVDVEYVFRNKLIRWSFMNAMRKFNLPDKLDEDEQKTVLAIRWFIDDNFPTHPASENVHHTYLSFKRDIDKEKEKWDENDLHF